MDNPVGSWARFDRALAPRSVAVYGASGSRQGLASGYATTIAANMYEHGYGSRLVLVNPHRQEVLDQVTVASAAVSELAGTIDFAVIAVPARTVLAAVKDCIASKIPLATIVSAGFAETGDEGELLEAAILSISNEHGFRFFGPNCLGVMNFTDDLIASTAVVSDAKAGPVSIIAQSGSIATSLLEQISVGGFGTDLWLTIGNAADISAAECVEYLSHRESTKTIVLYLESLGDTERFRSAMHGARRAGKEVVLLKSGRSVVGARTTASHTASMSSSDVFVDVLVRECDIIRVGSVREAAIVACVLSAAGRLRGRAGVIAASGGAAVLAADACEKVGVSLAVLGDHTVTEIKGLVPQSGVENPVDPTPLAFANGCIDQVLRTIAMDAQVDYLVYLAGGGMLQDSYGSVLRDALLPLASRLPIIVDGTASRELRDQFLAARIALTDDRECLWRSITHLIGERGRGISTPLRVSSGSGADDHVLMSEIRALEELAEAGIPMVRTVVISTEEALKSAINELGYPIVLKGIVPRLGHKTEHNLVIVDVINDAEAVTGFVTLAGRLKEHPEGVIVVQPQVRRAVAEVIIGSINDDQFGVHVMVGAGGIWAEVGSDHAWERAPISDGTALNMIRRFNVGRRLIDARRGITGDVKGLAAAIAKLSQWAVDHSADVKEVEINPMIVHGKGVVGVDALIRYKARWGMSSEVKTDSNLD